jgi:hypothetical protein
MVICSIVRSTQEWNRSEHVIFVLRRYVYDLLPKYETNFVLHTSSTVPTSNACHTNDRDEPAVDAA